MAAGSVTKAMAILRYLATAKPCGVNAIARAVDISPSSCFNILKALVESDFVAFDTRTKLYEIGVAPAKLFSGESVGNTWTRWINKELLKIAQEFSTTTGLWRVWNDRLVLIDVLQSPSATGIHLSLGQRMPKYLGALGQCVASYESLPANRVIEEIGALKWHTLPDATHYLEGMNAARQRGWSIDDGSYLGGITAIAAVVGGRTHVQYGLTSFALRGQHEDETIAIVGGKLSDLARETERRLDMGRHE